MFRGGVKIRGIVVTAFCIIIGMAVLIGACSFIEINRLNYVNELNANSYEVFMEMQRIQEAIDTVDENISRYFSGNGWKTYTEPIHNTQASFKIENDQLEADITYPGLLNWSIQLYQGSIALNKGHKYGLSFEARSTLARDIQVLIENSVYYNKHHTQIVHIDNTMSTYTVYFTQEDGTDEFARVNFTLGYISPNTPEVRHQIYFDNISLIEVDTGKELINNGAFKSVDIENTLPKALTEISDAVKSASMLITDNAEQKGLLEKLAGLQGLWYEGKKKMIDDLKSKLKLSGALNADAELQSLESDIKTKTNIELTIGQIKQLEMTRLDQRKIEAETIKSTVYFTLSIVILLSILFFAVIYAYFSKAIIKPLALTSEILKDMSEDDPAASIQVKMKNEHADSAVFEIRQLYHHMLIYLNLLKTQIQIDGLTGISNRKNFEAVIRQWIGLEKRFILVLADIDHFKIINDTYGHLIGDDVIKHVADMLLEFSGDEDICFRFGGDEFGILVNGNDMDSVYRTAERLRKKVAESPNPTGKPISISLGISSYRPEDERYDMVFERADKALYESKEGGRNRTTVI